MIDEKKVCDYFRLTRALDNAHGGALKGLLSRKANRLWLTMNDEERQTVSKRWRDPS